MTDNITLPRDVGERLYDLLLDRIDGVYHASSEDIALRDALDAALAEPDAICSAKDNEAALERVANRVKPGQVKGLLPEPDATREPATDEQVTEAYISPDIDGRWYDFELGFRAAERFHGIRKEDK